MYNAEKVVVSLVDSLIDSFFNIRIAYFAIIRNYNVKNYICMCWTGYHSEVMHGDIRLNLIEYPLHLLFQFLKLRIFRVNGVKVYYHITIKFSGKLLFEIVYNIVKGQYITVCRYFAM